MRLRRSNQSDPGITRRRRGRGWQYLGPDGAPVPAEAKARIDALVIPPAWREVWICRWPHGHLQAAGTDDAGRRQYLYHEQWAARRNALKYARVVELAAKLPVARRRVAQGLALDGMPRERALAAAFRLLDLGTFRIGGRVYADTNGSFGLATLQREHVRIDDGALVFEYLGKSGVPRAESISDADVVAAVSTMLRRRSGGERVLAYRDGRGWSELDGAAINEYLHETVAPEFSAKDFRTWHATVFAAIELARETIGHGDSRWTGRARTQAVGRAIKAVAEELGNTPAVARGSYVNPRIVDLFLEGETIAETVARRSRRAGAPGDLAHDPVVEAAALGLLSG